MSGTHIGGIKTSKTNKKKHGPDFYARIGRMGGRARVPKGFALDKDLASRAGRIGGTLSKRGKAKK